jgi:hypothetical protein
MFQFLNNFRYDRTSFWIGFLAATLFWWLLSRLRPLLPIWRKQFRQYLITVQQRNFAGVDSMARRETLNRAQRLHLAAPLCALDDILIEPKLIAPPVTQAPSGTSSDFLNRSIASQVIPYMPDWPELSAPFGVPMLTIAESLENGAQIAVIGQPGSGKSVALAHLASQIARKEFTTGNLANAFPVFVHILDLDTNLADGIDPLAAVLKVISSQVGVVYQRQVPRYVQSVLQDEQRRLILILDGLDELPVEALSAAAAYLAALIAKYPRLQVITSASAEYLDGLLRAGFYPLGIAGWTPAQRTQLTQKFSQVWTDQIVPEAKRQAKYQEVDPTLINLWLSGDNYNPSPLEWTLRVWSAYSGDAAGDSMIPMLDTHMARFLPHASLMPALEELAHYMVQNNRISLSSTEMEKQLSSVKIAIPPKQAEIQHQTAQNAVAAAQNPAAPVFDAIYPEDSALAPSDTEQRKKSKKVSVSQGQQIIDRLLDGGVLVIQPNNQIRFANPVFLGFLSGLGTTSQEAADLVEKLDWVPNIITLHYAAACSDDASWIQTLLDDSHAPLYKNILLVSRWLRDAPTNAPWRSPVFRKLVNLIQQDLVPLGTRARLFGAFLLSRDPSMPKLFKQLLLSPIPTTRRLALLGCGALGSPQVITDVLGLMVDSIQEVRNTACLALAVIPGEAAYNAVVQVMLNGDEEIRQAAAEALALDPSEGHKALVEAIEYDDLLTRRAAVFGLMQVHEPWARKLLEKAAVADAQWVVRNASQQALVMLNTTSLAIPKPLPAPANAGWLIAFASKSGIGVSPDRPVTELLQSVLKSGSPEEQMNALEYLRTTPDEGVARSIYELLYGSEAQIKDEALTAAWWMSLTGARLPDPMQFGLG